MKLALAYIAQASPDAREDCNEFWKALNEPHASLWSPAIANTCRHGDCSRIMHAFYRALGVPDGSLWYPGVTGKREVSNWRPGSAFEDARAAGADLGITKGVK